MVVLDLALEFALLVFLGIFIIRFKITGAEFTSHLSSFVMKVALPCMIFNAIVSQEFSGEISMLFKIWGLSFLVMGTLAAVSYILYLITGKTLFGRCTIFSTVFGNYTYMGMAAAEGIYGSTGVFYYTIFTLPVRLLFYAAPSFLMRENAPKEKKSPKEIIAPFISPPTVSVALGLIFYLFSIPLPKCVTMTIKALGGTASTLGMLICGMGLASASVKSLVKSRRTYFMVLVRNFLAPAVVIGVLYLVPMASEIKQAVAIYGCVPVPSLLTVFTIQMKCPKDVREDCSSAVLLSTLGCIVTLPLWAMAISAVL